MLVRTITVGNNMTNCYLVGESESNKGIVIDPGADGSTIMETAAELDFEIEMIVLTHGHFDHIEAVNYVKNKTGAPIAVHEQDKNMLTDPQKNLSSYLMNKTVTAFEPEQLLQENDVIKAGSEMFKVIHTPGHSRGSICLYNSDREVLFSGDTIFKNGIGRIDFPGCSQEDLFNSISKKLVNLPAATRVYPGHNASTTIGDFKNKVWKQLSRKV